MVDATGAIYVIGGEGVGSYTLTNYQDVWASTDGGARAGLVLRRGMVGVYYQGVLLWYSGVLGGSIGYSGLLEG